MLNATNPSWLFLAGVAVLTTVLLRMTYRRRGTMRRGLAAARKQDAIASPTVLYPDVLSRLEKKEVEFNDLSREAHARLDNKIAILQRLLAEADTTIARLEQARLKHE